jgi:hypothetical protein
VTAVVDSCYWYSFVSFLVFLVMMVMESIGFHERRCAFLGM